MEDNPDPLLLTAPKMSKRAVLKRMRDLGVSPKTIFDVGVATGTKGLYGVFPDVRYVMVEPLAESAPFIQELLALYPGSIAVQAAAGRTAGEADFVVDPSLSGSSFLLKPKFGEIRQVRVVTIDDLVREHRLEGPFILKLDVQGYELEVLAGAEETLKQTEAVIAEASLWADKKRAGMTILVDLINWFNDRNFVLYDVAQIVRRKLDDAIAEMDLVFCPADSKLRQYERYKTDEQRAELIGERRRKFGLT
jgi:FkbM family methyltransferase